MSKTRNINVYSDVAAVLDAAIAAGGDVTYQCKHYAEAYRWRARAYQLRKMLMELAMEVAPPGTAPVTKYDHIFLTIDGKLPKEQRTQVHIAFRKPSGTLFKNGKEIPVTLNRDVIRDPLQDEMDALLGDLK